MRTCEYFVFLERSLPQLIEFCRNDHYKIEEEEFDNYFDGIERLEHSTTFWVPRIQMVELCNKVNLLKRLDHISEVMNAGRPKTTRLRRNQDIPEGAVIKRTHSDCGSHVFVPGEHRRLTWEKLEQGPPGSSWMAQEYSRHLRDLGEWRCVVVDGKLLYVVHTVYHPSKGVWKFVKADRFSSLEEIR